jgi:hypothetical protein
MKPGYQTSEFWLTLASQMIGLAALFHFTSAEDSKTLGAALSQGITAVFAFLASARTLIGYVNSRTNLKLGARIRD